MGKKIVRIVGQTIPKRKAHITTGIGVVNYIL
jgi:hypothetical protein